MTFEERCHEALIEPVYAALLNAHAVELSSDGYQVARTVARELLDDPRVRVYGWLRPDGSFSEQWPMADGAEAVLVLADRCPE